MSYETLKVTHDVIKYLAPSIYRIKQLKMYSWCKHFKIASYNRVFMPFMQAMHVWGFKFYVFMCCNKGVLSYEELVCICSTPFTATRSTREIPFKVTHLGDVFISFRKVTLLNLQSRSASYSIYYISLSKRYTFYTIKSQERGALFDWKRWILTEIINFLWRSHHIL